MAKRIGFKHYDDNQANSQIGGGKNNLQHNSNEDIYLRLESFIRAQYSPVGETEKRVYKTSAELVYDLANITEVTNYGLAKVLTRIGCKIEYIAGQPYWVLYEL